MSSDMPLFSSGAYVLHSGERSKWKICCEALTDGDLQTLGSLLRDRLPPFSSVEGVPTGGLRFAEVMRQWQTGRSEDPLLICDDVYSTGDSLEAHRAGRWAIGAALFARRKVTQPWIMPLFSLMDDRYQNDLLF